MPTSTPNPTRNLLFVCALGLILFSSMWFVQPVHSTPLPQATQLGILAEALGEANLRNGPGLEYDQVGVIRAGTRYTVLGRSEFYPWLLLELPGSSTGSAWVFQDLVSLNTSFAQIPIARSNGSTGVSTPVPVTTSTLILEISETPEPPPDSPTTPASAEAFSAYMETATEVNVRFGPGIEYPRIGQLVPGHRYGVLSRHALYPWVLIEFPDAPEGSGWVFTEVVTIIGNLNSLPVITAEEVGWPTLTPTPPFVVTTNPPWATSTQTPTTPNGSLPDLEALGESLLSYLLNLGFAPEEDTFASVFLLDLQSGNNISFGRDIAYSGMSLIKIPILVEFFRQADFPPDPIQAELIANTMICSGNHTANDLLALVGSGDAFVGAQTVTNSMHALGLQNTFIVAPFKLGDEPIEPRPVSAPAIPADQEKAAPDPFNQTTPEDLGWLLGGIYQCAMNESGPLIETFPGDFTATECRQIILTMSRNQINVLTEAGVPIGTTVAHKHGWIDDTHGDASIVFTDGGDFVLTMALHGRDWLPYEQSWPAMADLARTVYNAYNPQSPLEAIHPATVNETCELQGNPLLAELQQSIIPPF